MSNLLWLLILIPHLKRFLFQIPPMSVETTPAHAAAGRNIKNVMGRRGKKKDPHREDWVVKQKLLVGVGVMPPRFLTKPIAGISPSGPRWVLARHLGIFSRQKSASDGSRPYHQFAYFSPSFYHKSSI